MIVICLCGKARSGKDTVADYLQENFMFYKVAFASKMKSIFIDLFNLFC